MLLRNVALSLSINVQLTRSDSHDNNKGDWFELTSSAVYKHLTDGRCDGRYSCMKHKLWISEDNKRRLVKIKIDEYRLRLIIYSGVDDDCTSQNVWINIKHTDLYLTSVT